MIRSRGRVVAVAVALLGLGCSNLALPGRDTSSELDEPWQIGAAAYPTQRLYRVHYEGPEGKASFKLTVYLVDQAVYRMQAADTLGRQLWVLRLDRGDRGLWINHRERSYCYANGAVGLPFLPLASLPLSALPRLLVGRLPALPRDDLRRLDERLSYLDERGQAWVATIDGNDPLRWSLLDAGEPVAWWHRDGDGVSVFSDRRGQQQVRWQEVVREPLTAEVPSEPIPPGYREQICG